MKQLYEIITTLCRNVIINGVKQKQRRGHDGAPASWRRNLTQ